MSGNANQRVFMNDRRDLPGTAIPRASLKLLTQNQCCLDGVARHNIKCMISMEKF